MVGRREITSSNGESELRYVIETEVQIGEQRWPIEVTLTNLESLQYRIILGRTAVKEDMIVDPNQSFLQDQLSYDLYNNLKRTKPVECPLRIGLLTREPENYSSRRIIQVAEDRGHVCEVVNPTRCYMNINALAPEVHYGKGTLPLLNQPSKL
jgi:ribosomal protein S6--L-glutamate ligase